MTTIQEVGAMLEALTPYSMPSDETKAQTLYNIADEIVEHDIPTASDTDKNRACAYYVAHLLSGKNGSSNITSEHLGEWSATYKTTASGSSFWLEEYRAMKYRILRGKLISTAMSVTIDDTETSKRYPLDSAGVP